MERLDGFVRRRRELAAAYRELLPRTVAMQHVAPTAEPNYQTLAVIMDDGATSADRDALIDALRRQGIEATVASYCLPLLPAYAAFAQDVGAFPEALAAHERGLALPMYVSMSDDDVARVCSALR
jgi:dTDP-4-amino-4,6-dideoxygalactose transaminase